MKLCMKCKTAPAVLTLADIDSAWEYCTHCATISLHGAAPEYAVYPAKGMLWIDLPADALALCRS